ncbi:unnamed protein product [Sphagnum tenellum]
MVVTLCSSPGFSAIGLSGRNCSLRHSSLLRSGVLLRTRFLKTKKFCKTLDYKEQGKCRAGLEDDAPFAIAITAALMSTLVLPVNVERDESKKGSSALGADDVRYAAMGVISFIPLFNWLTWVFAWLDTGKQRYLVYAIVYLAPYLRTGLSISPEDSWLPLASVLACIIHVQLDISVNNEGGQGLNISKVLFERNQVKQMKEHADTLLLRLQNLAVRTDIKRAKKEDDEEQNSMTGEDVAREELEQWDEKFAELKAKEHKEKE